MMSNAVMRTLDDDPISDQCWEKVADDGPSINQLLGMTSIYVFNFVMKCCIPQIIIVFFSEFLDF